MSQLRGYLIPLLWHQAWEGRKGFAYAAREWTPCRLWGGGLHKFLVCGIGSMQLGALMHKNQNLMAQHEGRPLCPGGGLFESDQTLGEELVESRRTLPVGWLSVERNSSVQHVCIPSPHICITHTE